MGDTSLKFGGWGLCRTCWRQSQVKANGEKTKKKSGKKRGWKKKKSVEMVLGEIDRLTLSS